MSGSHRLRSDEYTGMTITKACRWSLYALSTGSAVASVATVAQPSKPLDSKRVATAVAGVMTSLSLFKYAWNLRDYGDSREVKMMSKQAKQLSFDEMIKIHGVARIQKVATVELIHKKFRGQFDGSLLVFMEKQPFSTMIKQGIISIPLLREWFRQEALRKADKDINEEFFTKCRDGKIIDAEEFQRFKESCDAIKHANQTFETRQEEIEEKHFARDLRHVSQMKLQEKRPPKIVEKLVAQVIRTGNIVQEGYNEEIGAAIQVLRSSLQAALLKFKEDVQNFNTAVK